MSQEKFWVLISKKLSGEASADELTELEKLILEHPQWQYAIQNLEDLWQSQPPKDTSMEEDAYMLHLHRMNELNIPFEEMPVTAPVRQLNTKKRRWYWAAAALAGITVAGFLLLSGKKDKQSAGQQLAKHQNEVSTRPGSRSRVQLPDGTVVLLNAGSKLVYNKDFGIDSREVTLTGEGFFDVKKMKDKPFIIHTAAVNIKVLGTVFNVKAYPEDKRTETSLLRGSIEVTIPNRPNDKIILSPSEKLVVENNSVLGKEKITRSPDAEAELSLNALISVNKLQYNYEDSAVLETQWIENKFVFRDESFDQLVLMMERWYDVKIELADRQLKEKRFSGSFEKETIDEALEAMKITTPFKYEKTANKIIIHR